VTSPVLSDGSASFTPSGENRAGVKTAYHGGLKSFDTQTNAAQSIVGQSLTDAFGNQISSAGVWKGRFAYGGPYGYQEDPDTGLRLLGHRYYDSSTGRFLTRDPIKDGWNWYVYCDSNPVILVDPNGLEYHDPVRVEVDPEFEGKVWVTGETEDHPEDYFTIPLPGGYVSNAKMDVDYVTIVMPDGTIRRYFIPGSKFGSVRYRVDKSGNLVLISDRPPLIPVPPPLRRIPNPAYPYLAPQDFDDSLIADSKTKGGRRWGDVWLDRVQGGHPRKDRPHPENVVPGKSENF
jgi:RHS repeat-associated protein